ncbi:hypothetical protein KZZ52_35560 [Dactylosporangium sp. AC04546]|uniref:hypothetical protein n=1 Tax=Dactylosporangium sp. AC04546 TaxID=2862460 RepID=UPI001EDE5BD2|nr:hypothetical protein [Dactylosporangium sp. AC04546]WVK79289.1 hypothetical protein KZZ52_35560 [Dactylosporangium sp. AC04546]
MARYVNADDGGWTELRVHGVSGTPPTSMLDHLDVARVSGDAQAGCYRRRWESPLVSADTAERRLEAYSWGGLTAGGSSRALWLLLTPFLLVNVAYWARPDTGPRPGRLAEAARQAGAAVQRLFALSITLVAAIAAVTASMDLIGWQCIRPDGRSCTDRVSWLSFLTWDWLASPGRRLALTALFPLAAIGLLWWLANKTWRETEAVRVPAAVPDAAAPATLLEDRSLWNGTGPVRRLRAVHVTAWLAVVGIFLLTPFARHRPTLHGRFPAAELLLGCSLVLLAASVVLACLPSMTDRARPDRDDEPDHRRWDLYRTLPLIALAVDAAALVVLWLPGLSRPDPTPGAPRSPLPWLAATVEFVAAAQLVLLVAAAVAVAAMRRRTPVAADGLQPSAGRPVAAPPAWYGFGTVVFMMLGGALAAAYAAALVLTVAHAVGKPQTADRGADPFVVAMPYFWAAALSVPLVVLTVVLAVAGWVRIRRRTTAIVADVETTYATSADPRRARAIADIWARALVGDTGRSVAGVFVVLVALLLAAATAGYLLDADLIWDHAPWMVNVGDALVGLFAAGLFLVGRQTYRNPRFRRTVGILWDLGTFWPRATHPLAPPCYAERAVPDLLTRIRHLGRHGHVLLSCHSQGTVIGLAVVMQLTYDEGRRVGLLTYGSPLRRLYARFFPAYFNLPALLHAGAYLQGSPPPDTSEQARRGWPWRNLYRPSDPIGGPIFTDYPLTDNDTDNDDIDRGMLDPRFARADGDGSYPAASGHSGYPDDPAYPAAVTVVERLRCEEPQRALVESAAD